MLDNISPELLLDLSPFTPRPLFKILTTTFLPAVSSCEIPIGASGVPSCQFGNFLRVTEGYLRMAESPLFMMGTHCLHCQSQRRADGVLLQSELENRKLRVS